MVEALREAVLKMRARPRDDSLSWSSFAAIHGSEGGGFNKCPHGNWYLLPWHRAYLVMFERIARELTGFQSFALPYWDWTRHHQLPDAFAQETWKGRPNPLHDTSREFRPTDSLDNEIVGPGVIREILGQVEFERFGTSRPRGQNSLTPEWITRRTGRAGILELTPHNNVHGRIGGRMATGGSPLDPIFLMHHSNIDRIWAMWRGAGNTDSSDMLWLGMHFEDHFTNPDGSPYSPVVAELREPEALGYTYGITVTPPAPSPAVQALRSRLSTLSATPVASEGANIKKFEASNDQVARATQPLEVPVRVDPALVAAVARHSPPSAGAELLDFGAAREFAARGPQALLSLDDVAATDEAETQFRVFLNCDYLSQDTPISNDHYVGTFGFFGGHGDHDRHGVERPSLGFSLTAVIGRLFASALVAPDVLRVQIQPVPRASNNLGQAGTVAPNRVEITFISP